MTNTRRVIGSELIEAARQRGLVVFEVLPGDIVTALARETAQRMGIRLVDGPLEKPRPVRTDGHTSMRRALHRRSPGWVAPKAAVQCEPRRYRKIALVGAGGVGGHLAHLVAMADITDELALIDIAPGLAEATALDLSHASGLTGLPTRVTGSMKLEALKAAELVVVTAGRARTPGMSRADLTLVNRRVMVQTAQVIREQAPDAVVIVVTNPLDEMTYDMLQATGFPREQVLGMAGTLDGSRFQYALAKAAGVSPADVQATTLGSHGDEMVPVTSQATIKGRALDVFLDEETIAACVKEAITGGGQVVALKKTGSATIAPAHATMRLIEHLSGRRTGAVAVSVMLEGDYGIRDVVMGVPAHLGRRGLIEIEEWPLTAREREALGQAANAIRTRLGLG